MRKHDMLLSLSHAIGMPVQEALAHHLRHHGFAVVGHSSGSMLDITDPSVEVNAHIEVQITSDGEMIISQSEGEVVQLHPPIKSLSELREMLAEICVADRADLMVGNFNATQEARDLVANAQDDVEEINSPEAGGCMDLETMIEHRLEALEDSARGDASRMGPVALAQYEATRSEVERLQTSEPSSPTPDHSREIKCADDAREYCFALAKAGMAYHPEDGPEEVFPDRAELHQPMRARLNEMYALTDCDPCAVMVDAVHRVDGEPTPWLPTPTTEAERFVADAREELARVQALSAGTRETPWTLAEVIENQFASDLVASWAREAALLPNEIAITRFDALALHYRLRADVARHLVEGTEENA